MDRNPQYPHRLLGATLFIHLDLLDLVQRRIRTINDLSTHQRPPISAFHFPGAPTFPNTVFRPSKCFC
jgi:hypothetical protein